MIGADTAKIQHIHCFKSTTKNDMIVFNRDMTRAKYGATPIAGKLFVDELNKRNITDVKGFPNETSA